MTDINIEKMTLKLPAGFEHRAESISALIARQLGEASFSTSHDVPHIRLPVLKVSHSDSDRAIARQVSSGLVRQLENRHKGNFSTQPSGVNNVECK